MTFESLIIFIDQFYTYTHVPVLVYKDSALIYPHINVTLEHYQEILIEFPLLRHITQSKSPIAILSDSSLMTASFYYEVNEVSYHIVLGPVLITGIQTPFKAEGPLHFLNHQLSVDSEAGFLNQLNHFYFSLNHTFIPSHLLSFTYIDTRHNLQTNKKRFSNILDYRRNEGFTKDSYQMELRLIHYIQTRKIDKIKWIIHSLENSIAVTLSSNALQSARLKYVGFVTIVTRTAIKDGIPLETAFSLSDSLIEAMDVMTTSREVINSFAYAAEQFINLYDRLQTKEVSADIKQIYNYIDMHLTSKITLEELSEFTGKAPSYLSNKFKHEVGITISEYLLHRRLEEAKEMLLFTNFSSQEIADNLNFASQSYFIKRFREQVGQTPKAYRDTNWFYNIWD